MPTIPAPEYYSETVPGALYSVSGVNTLYIDPLVLPDDAANLITRGPITLRYALQSAYPPLRFVIPGLFVGERGGALTGIKAWRYMQERWTHHPRADVVGLHPNGKRAEFFLKELDFGAPVHIFAYTDDSALVTLGEVQVVEAVEGIALPALLSVHKANVER